MAKSADPVFEHQLGLGGREFGKTAHTMEVMPT